MDINHTQITGKRREVRISDGRETVEIVEENVEVINVAAAELRKVEEVAAAQAQAIAGRRGEEPVPEETDEPAPEAAGEPVPEAADEPAPEAAEEPASEVAEEPAPEASEEDEEATGESGIEAVEEAGTEAAEEDGIEAVKEDGTEAAEKAGTEAAEGTGTDTTGDAAEETVSDTSEDASGEAADEGAEKASVTRPEAYDSDATVRVIGVRFRNAVKVFYFNPGEFVVRHGSHVIVETVRGIEYGTVVGFPMNIKASKLTQPLKDVIRIATPEDDETERRNRVKEKEAYRICQEKIQAHGLEMKLINAEYTFDNSKVLFYFTADGRVDFRDLVKDLASVFRTRIELRQIGVRDETKILGGYGICGRPLCCHTWMSEFIPVSIKMAKEQNLSLNPGKISVVCGRLMCCLKNEAETYEELNRNLPKVGDEVQGKDGLSGLVESVNVLRQTVRILVEVDDEKEYHEYHVDDLTILRRRRRGGNRARKDNIDSKEAQELEKLESQERQSQNSREKGERSGRGNRPNRGENQGRGDRQDRGENQGRGDRQERGERQNRGESQERGDRPNRGNRQGRGDYQSREDNQNREDNQGRGDSQNRGNRRFNRRRNPNYQNGGQGPNGSGSNGATSD